MPENLCFFLPNHRAARLGAVSCFPTRKEHTLVARNMLAEGLLEEENSIHSKKCRAEPQETRRKYAEPLAGTGILAYLKDREFLYTN